MRSTIALIHLAIGLSLVVIAMAFAPAARADDDLPGRVGRMAELNGQIYLAPEDRASEWAEIGLNYPIVGGDNLWVSGDGRAEIDFGAVQLRLAGDTNVHVSRLDDRELSLFVAQGRAIVRVRTLEPGDTARIDTPNSQVTLLRPGLYRIDVSPDRQETTLVVREGEANAFLASGVQQVLPGQTATLFGSQDVQADVRNGTGVDGFDTWSASRDRYYGRSRATAYVSPQMVGSVDLDNNGEWQSYPDYGAVWFPTTVAAGWAPYRFGRWVSLPAWGLAWVDDAPWGYAPFHYGRWAFIGGRWGWCPGRYVARPVWAPALVAWYGGSGWGVPAARGPVYGWVPLGWRDPYIPSWRNCSSRCWTNYNRPYAVNVAERPRQPPTFYANNQVPGAVTAMSGAAFTAGKPVAPNVINLPSNVVATAPILAGTPMVKPLPIAANVVRPGNGVPAPASTAFATKPLRVPSQGTTAVPGAPGNTAQPWSKPSPAYNAAERPGNAVPQAARPASNAAPAPQRSLPQNAAEGTPAIGRPQAANSVPPAGSGAMPAPSRPAPGAVPPNPANVTAAPPARYRGPQGQENTPVVNRAEPAARPAPQAVPQQGIALPRTMQGAPVAPPLPQLPQPVGVMQPGTVVIPVPQAGQGVGRPVEKPVDKPGEKPAMAKPAPVPAPN